jgi:hypothetical protein
MRTRAARAGVTAALLPLVAASTACGGEPSRGGVAVQTVTITPTVTVTGKAPSSSSSSALGAPPKSPVKGRKYDFGTVTGLDSSKGYDIVVLDRWTDPSTSDATIARQGLQVREYQGMPFTNQNTRTVFRIPVAEDAVVLLHHCTAKDDPWQTRSGSVHDLGSLTDEDKILLLTLDADGLMVRAENLPRCP